MKTVYVITSGEYSDYSINAVFSTYEKAEKFIAGQDQRDDHNVEEWSMDEFEHHTSRTIWVCRMILLTGEVDREWTYTESLGPSERYTSVVSNGVCTHATSSVSEAHAFKLAVEKRQEILRANA